MHINKIFGMNKTLNKINLFLILWLINAFYVSPQIKWNENRYLDLMYSIVNDKTLKIDNYHYNTLDKANYNGHYYIGASPGLVFITLPVFITFKIIYPLIFNSNIEYNQYGYFDSLMTKSLTPVSFIEHFPYRNFILSNIFVVIFFISVISALTGVILYSLLSYFVSDEKIKILITIFFSFGTIFFTYSTKLFAHVPSTFFLLAGFYLLFRIKLKEINEKYIFLAGLLCGTSVLLDYYLIIIFSILFFYSFTFTKFKTNYLFIIGGCFPICILLVYNYIIFNNLFSLPYQFGTFKDIYNKGIFGVTMPDLKIILKLLFSFEKGYFIYNSVLLLSVYGYGKLLFKKTDIPNKNEIVLGLIIFICFLLFNAGRVEDWYGGGCFGPRYLLVTIPFVMLCLTIAINKITYVLFIVLGILSLIINWFGVEYGENTILNNLSLVILYGITSPMHRFLYIGNNTVNILSVLFYITGVIIFYIVIKSKNLFNKFIPILCIFLLIILIIHHLKIISLKDKYYEIYTEPSEIELSNKYPVKEISLPPVTPLAKGLRIESVLTDSINVVQGQKVGTVNVIFTDKTTEKFDIKAGIDTAEWAIKRKDVQPVIKHKIAKVSQTRIEDALLWKPFKACRYYTEFNFNNSGKKIDKLSIIYQKSVEPFSLVINKMFVCVF